MEYDVQRLGQFLDHLHDSPAAQRDAAGYLAQLDALDYEPVELILDRAQTLTGAFIAASALQRKAERTALSNDDAAHAQQRVLAKVSRYLDSAPLVTEKLLSIAALYAVCLLPDGINPLRRVFACLRGQPINTADEDSLQPIAFYSLSVQEHFLLLAFCQSLVEQIPKAKQSQQDKYKLLTMGLTFRMRSVSPLREGSEVLAQEVKFLLDAEPWYTRLVVKSLQCYRAWIDYAVHIEEVKFEILFSDLANTFDENVGQFFANPDTIWTAADVYGDIAEWSSLSKTADSELKEIVASDVVQESYCLYLEGTIGLDSFSAIALLAIRLAETEAEKLLVDLNPINSKLLEIMLFLLSSDLSSRTFTFWISFAEASVNVGDGSLGEPWLRQALALFLKKTAWADDADEDEWMGYRTDVVEVFEVICEAMESETVNSVVTGWLDNTTRLESATEKLVSLEVILFFLTSVKNEFTLSLSAQESLLRWIFEIIQGASPHGQALAMLYKTVLSLFVPYAKSLEMFGLSFKALEVSFQAITIPSISHSAARSIDKLIRSSALIALHPEEIAQAIHQLISSRVEISDKVVIVEGYTFLVAQSLGKEEIPRHISPVFQAFANLDLESCDSALALEALKVCFAVGRTLYTTAPGKVDALAWTDGVGLEMVDWVGRSVAMFSRRFPEDFEVIEMVTSIVEFSSSRHGGLFVFSPADVPPLIMTIINKQNALSSNASTLLLSLAASVTKAYTNPHRPDVREEIALLMVYLSDCLLPDIYLPDMQHFMPEILQQPIVQPFHTLRISNPEVFSEFFRFLSQTIPRYSVTWGERYVQRWMSCILVALGYPESGLAFQGAIDFLTSLVAAFNKQPPHDVKVVFVYYREAVFAQIIVETISAPAPRTALSNLASLLRLLLRTKPEYPRMWLDLLEKYVVKGSMEERSKFCRGAMRYRGDKAMLEIVREWWTSCR